MLISMTVVLFLAQVTCFDESNHNVNRFKSLMSAFLPENLVQSSINISARNVLHFFDKNPDLKFSKVS